MFSPSFKGMLPLGECVVFIIAYVLHAVPITTNKSQQGQTGNLISQLAFNPTSVFLSDVKVKPHHTKITHILSLSKGQTGTEEQVNWRGFILHCAVFSSPLLYSTLHSSPLIVSVASV